MHSYFYGDVDTNRSYLLMCAMGESIGDAVWQFNCKNAIEQTEKLVKKLCPYPLDSVFYLHVGFYEDRSQTTYQYDIDELIGRLNHRYHPYDFKSWDHFIASIHEDFSDGDMCLISILTKEEYKKKEQEDRRKELESTAAAFSKKCNHPVGSMEFLEALRDAIDRSEYQYENYNSMERKMEEWMDHRYAGATEYYYDNRNYTNSQLRETTYDLYDVWEWLEQNCPLLICQWKESQLHAEENCQT